MTNHQQSGTPDRAEMPDDGEASESEKQVEEENGTELGEPREPA